MSSNRNTRILGPALVAVFSTFACDSSVELTEKSAGCFIEFGEYLQIIYTKVDAGEATIEAYRFSSNGMLSGATWNEDGNSLTGVSALTQLTPEMYLQSVSELSEVELSFPPDDGTLRQRTGTFELVSSNQEGFERQLGLLGTDVLESVLEQWRSTVILNDPPVGNYYLSSPFTNNLISNRIDFDLEANGCLHPLSAELLDGAVSNAVVQPASGQLVEFIEQTSSARRSFTAKSGTVGITFSGIYSR